MKLMLMWIGIWILGRRRDGARIHGCLARRLPGSQLWSVIRHDRRYGIPDRSRPSPSRCRTSWHFSRERGNANRWHSAEGRASSHPGRRPPRTCLHRPMALSAPGRLDTHEIPHILGSGIEHYRAGVYGRRRLSKSLQTMIFHSSCGRFEIKTIPAWVEVLSFRVLPIGRQSNRISRYNRYRLRSAWSISPVGIRVRSGTGIVVPNGRRGRSVWTIVER